MSAREMMKMANVTLIATTDDPADTLEWHKKIAEDETFDIQVLPAWRPEKAMNINKPDYMDYLMKLSDVSGVEIKDFASLLIIAIFVEHNTKITYKPNQYYEVNINFEKFYHCNCTATCCKLHFIR